MTALWTHFALNLAQIAFLLIFAPLVEGVLHRLEEIIQGKRGPSIWQTYRDIWKLFGKEEVISEESTWVFRFAPIVAFVCGAADSGADCLFPMHKGRVNTYAVYIWPWC